MVIWLSRKLRCHIKDLKQLTIFCFNVISTFNLWDLKTYYHFVGRHNLFEAQSVKLQTTNSISLNLLLFFSMVFIYINQSYPRMQYFYL